MRHAVIAAALACLPGLAAAQTAAPQPVNPHAGHPAGHQAPAGAAAPAATPPTPAPADPATPQNHSGMGANHQPAAAPGNANVRNPDPR